MTDDFEGGERFVYRHDDGPDLSPPHAIWDKARDQWSGIGSFGTEAEARACAAGMNAARELFRRKDRALGNALRDVRNALRSIETAISSIT